MSDLPTFFADTSMLEDEFDMEEEMMVPSFGDIPRSSSAFLQQQLAAPATYTNYGDSLPSSFGDMDQQLQNSVNDILYATQSLNESGWDQYSGSTASSSRMVVQEPYGVAQPPSRTYTPVASSSNTMDTDLDGSLAALREAINTFQWPASSSPSPFVEIPRYDTDESYMELVRQNATRYTMMPQDEADVFGAPTDEAFEATTYTDQAKALKAQKKLDKFNEDLKRVWDIKESDRSLQTIVRRQTDLTVLPQQSAEFINALQTTQWLEFVVFDRAKKRGKIYPDIEAADRFSRRPLSLEMDSYAEFIERMKKFPALYDLPSSTAARFRSKKVPEYPKWLSIRKVQVEWLKLFTTRRPPMRFRSTNMPAIMTLSLPDPDEVYFYRCFPILLIRTSAEVRLYSNEYGQVVGLSCFAWKRKRSLYGPPPVTFIWFQQDGSGVDPIGNTELQALLIALACVMNPESRQIFIENCEENNGIQIRFLNGEQPPEDLVFASVMELTRIGLDETSMLYMLHYIFGRPISRERKYPLLTESEASKLIPEFNALRIEQRTYQFEPRRRSRR